MKKWEGQRENLQISGSQPGMTLPPGDIWQDLETFFGCHYWGGCATSIQWAEVRAITKHLAICTGQCETVIQTRDLKDAALNHSVWSSLDPELNQQILKKYNMRQLNSTLYILF